MKFIIIFLLGIFFNHAMASNLDEQITQYYASAKKVSAQNLLPKKFIKLAEAKGDLNADGIDDLALLIRSDTKKSESDIKQIVVLLLGDKDGQFSFWKTGTNHFVDSNSDFMEENGVGSFMIKNRVLNIGSSTAMSMGGWGSGGCLQKWRNEASGFRLIGLTRDSFDRKCACGTSKDINFITGGTQTKTDSDAEGKQLPKKKISSTKDSPKTILWENFSYQELCKME